jgi:hypothetical protein
MRGKFYFLLLFVIVLTSCALFSETGKTYLSIRGLAQDQDEKGYVLISTFGDFWPAKVVEVKTAMHEISFKSESFGDKVYSGYHGYKLKVLKLSADNDNEVFIVLRSRNKI